MTQPTPANRQHRHLPALQGPPTRLDCEGCPVASGEVPDASCAECVVSVFLAAEPWLDDGPDHADDEAR